MKRLPIGISDFKELIEQDYYYVDTTPMIEDVLNEPAKIILLTRPRRFGKTLNMSMLRYFYDNRLESSALFKPFTIAENEEAMKEMNGYPVIFITFKDINDREWSVCEDHLKNLLADLYKEKEEELSALFQDEYIEKYYRRIVEKTAKKADYKDALKKLTTYLYKVYNKPVILLIDEYDVPIQSGWLNGYYDEIIDMMKGVLSGALKDNTHLFKSVLTGIYRVAKESIFSGLNNLKVYTILKERYAKYFGFTEDEVEKLIQQCEIDEPTSMMETIREWYNGYRFGSHTIYNPWSVVNSLFDKERQPYWINTSSNDLIINLIDKNLKDNNVFRNDIEKLIANEGIEKVIEDSSALRDIEDDPGAIWSLFLFSGYLRAQSQKIPDVIQEDIYDCYIPNREVLHFYRRTVLKWLRKPNYYRLTDIIQSLLKGDAETFSKELGKYVSETLSYHDISQEPENTYHILLLGMFAQLQRGYYIRSNRESGKGRYDILLKAKDKNNTSAVIEIKKSAEDLSEALEQIQEKDYARELESEGYTKIMKLAIGVDGKTIKTAYKE